MEPPALIPRAVIFDVYSTILEVGPPPADADVRWQNLFQEMPGPPPPVSRADFAKQIGQAITRRHAEAKAHGIPWPEIQWPDVVREVLPVLSRLSAPRFNQFLLRQMQLGRTLRLAGGAAECLRWLNENRRLLGIASNAQAYTLTELDAALNGAGLNLSMFDRDVRFWSFENGFSKPDPHAFRILTARLEARGVLPAEILMVGDRWDNDIQPAQAFGWQTWQITSNPHNKQSGNWTELLAWLKTNR